MQHLGWPAGIAGRAFTLLKITIYILYALPYRFLELRSNFRGNRAFMACHMKIHLAGGVRICSDGAEIKLAGKKARALLAILALSEPLPVGRDKLCALLWSESGQAAARASLRQTLRRLRGGLGLHANKLLRVTAEGVGLNSEAVEIDVTTALKEARAGRAPGLLQERPNALSDAMTGLDFIDPNFANWIAVRRQMMHQDAVDALGDALAEFVPPDPRGTALARVLRRMEPTHEAACRYLMRAYQTEGNVSAALTIYDELWHLLDEEFDTLPSENTQRLIVEIKLSSATLPPPPVHQSAELCVAPRTVGLIDEPRRERPRQPPAIWIERFETESLDDAKRHRAMGLRSDFIAALCRFREWRVFDGGDDQLRSEDLPAEGTAFSLSGTAVTGEQGDDIILNFRNLRTSEVIWSERTTISIKSWGRAQRRAVRRIAIALSLHLSTDRLSKIHNVADSDLPAHDAWLLGQALLNHWSSDSEDRAEALFRDILRDHPDFAPAYTGLAQVLNTRHFIRPGLIRSRGIHAEALNLSIRSVAIDPLDAKAQLALAWSFALNGAWDNAVQTFHVACDLNENDPWTAVSSSLGFAYCGESAEAMRLSKRMLDVGLGITPLHWAYIAGVCFLSRDYEEAATAAARGAGATYYIAAWQGAALAHMGQVEEARIVLRASFDEVRARWTGPSKPTDRAISEWLLHCYPIRADADWFCLRDGFAAAGAPVPKQRPGVLA